MLLFEILLWNKVSFFCILAQQSVLFSLQKVNNANKLHLFIDKLQISATKRSIILSF